MKILSVTFSVILWGFSVASVAQTTKADSIFGSFVERKIQRDSTKKKVFFNPLKPAFLRIGFMGGGLIGFENTSTRENFGGTAGVRVEYGFSNRLSLVSELNGNSTNKTTFSRVQVSFGTNWMPFKSRRLQPYVGLSGGISNNGFGDGRGSKNKRGSDRYIEEDTRGNNRNSQAFGAVRLGLNYVLLKRIIATTETAYQIPFNANGSNGGVSLRIGLAYQFSKQIKK